MTSHNFRARTKHPGPEVPTPQHTKETPTSRHATETPASKRVAQAPTSGRVAEIQRQRILGAMAQVAAERGAANVTVAHIVARAGISRRTFYELFEDRETCLVAALDEAIAAAAAVVLPA